MSKDARIEVRVTQGVKSRIEREASRLGMTTSELLRALFNDHLQAQRRARQRCD